MSSTVVRSSRPTESRRLSPAELRIARQAIENDGTIDAALAPLGLDSSLVALQQVAESLGLQFVDLTEVRTDRQLVDSFPTKLIHRFGVFPLSESDTELQVLVGNPFDLNAIDSIAEVVGKRTVAVVAPATDLARLVKAHLGVGAETVDGLMAQDDGGSSVEILEDVAFDGSEASEAAQEASVVRLVNDILREAVEARASDIHIEAQASGIKIRYRIDGVLQRQPTPSEMNRFHPAIISRLKIMAKLNIAEKRVPQDGRIKLRVSGREIDIRVSVIPMLHGEGIVMRVLDKDAMQFDLRGIGMPESIYRRFHKLITLPHGIVLVTGPTGSGKTTTLYSALSEIKDEKTKIITTEDPIEYQLEGINQIQVQPKVGLTFAASLRSILRHDPDVVLVGEIRDLETGENATQASLTGHLVFSTLHTNDSASAFMRLCDMGVEPFLVSSTVEGVMAQRLVRTLCNHCREEYMPAEDEVPTDFPWEQVVSTRAALYRPAGCRECRGTGYSGRSGIYELLVSNDEIRSLANERKPAPLIKKLLSPPGWKRYVTMAGLELSKAEPRLMKFCASRKRMFNARVCLHSSKHGRPRSDRCATSIHAPGRVGAALATIALSAEGRRHGEEVAARHSPNETNQNRSFMRFAFTAFRSIGKRSAAACIA